MTEELAVFLLGVGGLSGAFGMLIRYMLRRIRCLETGNEESKLVLRTKRDQLQTQVANLSERSKRIPILEAQIMQLSTTLASVNERLTEAETGLNAQRAENERLKRENRLLLGQNHELTIETRTLKQALALLGIKLDDAEKQQEPPEPAGEEQVRDQEPAGEGASRDGV